MKKLILGAMSIFSSILGIAIISLAAPLSQNSGTHETSLIYYFKLYGMMPEFIIFIIIGIVGALLAIIGLKDRN